MIFKKSLEKTMILRYNKQKMTSKGGDEVLDNRIDRIYEAERMAAVKRDRLIIEQKERLAAVKKQYETELAEAESAAEIKIALEAEKAKQAAASEMEKAKEEAAAEADAILQDARQRLPSAAEFIIREIFQA